jgi:hypothetical protein
MLDSDQIARPSPGPSLLRRVLTNATWIAFFLIAGTSLLSCAGFVLWGAAWMVGIV